MTFPCLRLCFWRGGDAAENGMGERAEHAVRLHCGHLIRLARDDIGHPSPKAHMCCFGQRKLARAILKKVVGR